MLFKVRKVTLHASCNVLVLVPIAGANERGKMSKLGNNVSDDVLRHSRADRAQVVCGCSKFTMAAKRRNLKNLSLIVPPSAPADSSRLSRSAPSTPPPMPSAVYAPQSAVYAPPSFGVEFKAPAVDGPPPSAFLQSVTAGKNNRDRKFSEASTFGMDLSLVDDPYANGPVAILPGLWLGTEINARDRKKLRDLNIGWVLCVAKEVEREYRECPSDPGSTDEEDQISIHPVMDEDQPSTPKMLDRNKMEFLLAKLMEEERETEDASTQTDDQDFDMNHTPNYVGRGSSPLPYLDSKPNLRSSAPFSHSTMILPDPVIPFPNVPDHGNVQEVVEVKKKKRRGGRGRRSGRRKGNHHDSNADVSSSSAASSRNASPNIFPMSDSIANMNMHNNQQIKDANHFKSIIGQNMDNANIVSTSPAIVHSNASVTVAPLAKRASTHLTPDVLQPLRPGSNPRSPSPLGRHVISADEGDADLRPNATSKNTKSLKPEKHKVKQGEDVLSKSNATQRRPSKSGKSKEPSTVGRTPMKRLSSGGGGGGGSGGSGFSSPSVKPVIGSQISTKVPYRGTQPVHNSDRAVLGSVVPPRNIPGQAGRSQRKGDGNVDTNVVSKSVYGRPLPPPITTTPPPEEQKFSQMFNENMNVLRSNLGTSPKLEMSGLSRDATMEDSAKCDRDVDMTDVNHTPPPLRDPLYRKFSWGHNQDNLIEYFPKAFEFIDRARQSRRGGVLVHCQMGVSRSASLVLAYVMREKGWRLNQAYDYVKERSWVISPNMSLVYQLAEYEKVLGLRKDEDEDDDLMDADMKGENNMHDGPMSVTVSQRAK